MRLAVRSLTSRRVQGKIIQLQDVARKRREKVQGC